MAKPTVYVETSVISYLTAPWSRDVVNLARQQTTRDWWEARRNDFELRISEAVLEEASKGNAEKAARRLEALQGIAEIQLDEGVRELAELLIVNGPLPSDAVIDAIHIAAAVSAPVDYLLTWNFKHMANAVIRTKIEKTLRSRGFEPCVICTPEELMEVTSDA